MKSCLYNRGKSILSGLKTTNFGYSYLHSFIGIISTNSVQFSSVSQSCPTLCSPMDCSMPVFPIHHQHQGPTQTHVHWVGDAIQPSHPLSSASPPAFNISQNQGLFQWVRSLPQIVKVLELHLQSFQWIFRSVSFRIDWFDLLAVQGTLKSLLQHHSSKAYICCCSCIHTYMLSCVQLCVTPWTVARQAPLSMGFSRQIY